MRLRVGVQGFRFVGFRVSGTGLELRFDGLGFGGEVAFEVWELGLRVWGLGVRV